MSLFSRKGKPSFSVILVIDNLVVGGAESQAVMLAGGLNKLGYHCEVFALRAEGGFCAELESLGIPVKNGKFSKGRDRLALLQGVWRLWRCIYQSRPCIVHTYLPLSNFIGSIAARLAGASFVITSRRGLGIHQESDPRWKYRDRISNALSSKISVNSKAVGNDTIRRDGVDSKKIVCVYNGLDFSRFQFSADMRQSMRSKLGLSPSDFAWVMVANLFSYKGHLDLLQAFSAIPRNCVACLFLVGRDSGVQQKLETMVADLGIADRVVFLGGRSDVPEILSAMDGYVVSSHSEGFSNAILEAMAAGLPIVATNVGGNAEALQDGKAGILVSPHDPDALCSAMKKIMDNQESRENFSRVAKQAAREKYSVEAMVANYLDIYRVGLKR